MRQTSLILLMPVILFFANCGDNKATTAEKNQTDNGSSNKKEEPASNSTAQGDDIIGEWEMVGSVMDTNDNLQIDEAERKDLKPTAINDYMKFNRDGTGLFTLAKMEGRYEGVAKENGKKYYTWYDSANGPHKIGAVINVTKDELHIKEPGGAGLFIWKRL